MKRGYVLLILIIFIGLICSYWALSSGLTRGIVSPVQLSLRMFAAFFLGAIITFIAEVAVILGTSFISG